jgi:5,10-methylene-tetrahydrofolate dehydrogenase/methenyl tetrahydrofolate cyclohydrolase
MAHLLLGKNATVTIAHSKTRNLPELAKQADILVVAIGRGHFVTKEFVKEGAVVIDVGMNRDDSGKLIGDVKFDEVEPHRKLHYTSSPRCWSNDDYHVNGSNFKCGKGDFREIIWHNNI